MSRKRGPRTSDPRWQFHMRPAPGDLRIVQALVSSGGTEGQAEEFSTPRALADWLRHWGLLAPGSELVAEDLELALNVRSALRALIRAGNATAPKPEAIDVLASVAATAPLYVNVDSRGQARLRPSEDGLNGAITRLLEIMVRAQREGSWQRLKFCQRQGCDAAFYDFSNARVAKWCSARCGDLGSSSTYRQRLRRHKARKLRENQRAI